MPDPRPSPSLRALVAGLVDYAGLFPPASLTLSYAAARYAGYRESRDAWMLGRFVVPVDRLGELAAAAIGLLSPGTPAWRLSALVGDDVRADASRIRAFNDEQRGRFEVDAVEAKAADAERLALVARALGAELEVYIELPYEPDPRSLLEAVRRAGLRAKIRTGGVTSAAFPSAAQVARFVRRCAELGVPFKATAGLHHPLRGEHRLTYDANSPTATMFGFLNLFVAAAIAAEGRATEAELVAVLEERDRGAFGFTAESLRWRGHEIPVAAVAKARESFAVAFGSCSFREPVDDLQELALL